MRKQGHVYPILGKAIDPEPLPMLQNVGVIPMTSADGRTQLMVVAQISTACSLTTLFWTPEECDTFADSLKKKAAEAQSNIVIAPGSTLLG